MADTLKTFDLGGSDTLPSYCVYFTTSNKITVLVMKHFYGWSWRVSSIQYHSANVNKNTINRCAGLLDDWNDQSHCDENLSGEKESFWEWLIASMWDRYDNERVRIMCLMGRKAFESGSLPLWERERVERKPASYSRGGGLSEGQTAITDVSGGMKTSSFSIDLHFGEKIISMLRWQIKHRPPLV